MSLSRTVFGSEFQMTGAVDTHIENDLSSACLKTGHTYIVTNSLKVLTSTINFYNLLCYNPDTK